MKTAEGMVKATTEHPELLWADGFSWRSTVI